MAEVKNEKGNQERRFSQEQYEFLKMCSKKGDDGIKEWNEWREENSGEEIWLEGRNLARKYLKGVNLFRVHLKGAIFIEAHLENADLRFGELEDADLFGAHLEGVELAQANLKGAKMSNAHLESAKAWSSNMEGATLGNTHLEGANMSYSYLNGASFSKTQLQSADFQGATVYRNTSFCDCEVNRNTDFRGVGLDSCRIDPGTKQLLEYNNRRINWEDWYKEHWFWRWPVRLFWAMSDYGRSTGRIVLTFFMLALVFAIVYYFVPNLVKDLHVTGHSYSDFIRSCYFSVVTMTTLGFGDMFANHESIAGHVILMVQVILGYVLLGALVTRFAVLFSAGGPAGTFADGKKRTP